MPLTREQLAGLPPPTGWIWHTRPTLRTRGYIVVDEAHGVSAANASERMGRLRDWAIANDLGIRTVPLNVARSLLGRTARFMIPNGFYDLTFAKLFKVVANKPEHTSETFGSYTCSCGLTTLDIDNPVCQSCGTHKCAFCSNGYVKLYSLDGESGRHMVCATCTKPCTGCNTSRVRGTERCRRCEPRLLCILCMTEYPRDKLQQISSVTLGRYARRAGGEDVTFICKRCVSRYHCEKCGGYDFSQDLSAGKVCATCQAKELDKKRVPLEKLPDDWIPAGGSLLIPSTDFRPFRTISIEMELNGDGPLMARTLYACGLVPFPEVAGYHNHADVQAEFPCFLKHDGSVSAGELIAYLLNLDDKAHADVLMDVCKKVHSLVQLKKLAHGPTAGGHIHADAHNFSYGDVWRLVTIFGYIEDPLYRIGGAGDDFGHRSLRREQYGHRSGGYAASPVKGPFGTKGQLGNSIQGQGRHHGLNFTPYLSAAQVCKCGSMLYDDAKNCKCNLGKSTIEFRLFNSTHNPRILHAWIALVQALMAWSTGDGDPTAEWEKNYPALPWTATPWKSVTAEHKDLVASRIEWVFRNLPLTDNERDSLVYTIEQSEIDLGKGFPDHLRGILPVTEFEVKKAARNPARRQRAIRVAVPTPGDTVPLKRASINYDGVTRPARYNISGGVGSRSRLAAQQARFYDQVTAQIQPLVRPDVPDIRLEEDD